MASYVALLRGINVGGSNLIRMAALKACFEAKRFSDVATYIQSGNVLFTASRGNQATLTGQIEKALSKTVRLPVTRRGALVRADEGDRRKSTEGLRPRPDSLPL